MQPVELSDGGMAGIGRYHVGFGFRVGEDWDGRAVAHHAGVTPGVRSIVLAYRDGGAVVALLSNARWTARIETTAELLAAPFLEDERKQSGPWSPREPFPISGISRARRADGCRSCASRIVPSGLAYTCSPWPTRGD